MSTPSEPDQYHVQPSRDLEIHFADRPSILASHLQTEDQDRVMIAMPVECNRAEAPLLVLSHTKVEDGLPIQQAIYATEDGLEKAFIGIANDGSGALFLLVDGDYQRLDFDMLERHIRANPFFGETMHSPG